MTKSKGYGGSGPGNKGRNNPPVRNYQGGQENLNGSWGLWLEHKEKREQPDEAGDERREGKPQTDQRRSHGRRDRDRHRDDAGERWPDHGDHRDERRDTHDK